jgi:sec-independent protein translocase protein TatC
MVNLLPHLIDMPMSLGDHLHELRKRVIFPLLVFVVFFIAAFCFSGQLKHVFLLPLLHAFRIAGHVATVRLGFTWPVTDDEALLVPISMTESPMMALSVSFYAAFAATIPILLFQIWRFVSVGLMPKERQLAFLFVPVGVIFFYLGTVFGFYIGLPYYFSCLIAWNAHDPTVRTLNLGQTLYQDSFTMMTICCGLIMDIPWLVMVLVRIGMVTTAQLARWRKLVVMINTVIAAFVAPPDGYSMLAMMIPLQLLFEGGLLMSRVMMWRLARSAAREARATAEAEAKQPGPAAHDDGTPDV